MDTLNGVLKIVVRRELQADEDLAVVIVLDEAHTDALPTDFQGADK